MEVLSASSSGHRQRLYRAALEGLGHTVRTAAGGLECVEQLRRSLPDVLLLEAPLLWGSSDGVLAVLQQELGATLPVILVAVGTGSIDWFELSRYRIDDLLFRIPTRSELAAAMENAQQRTGAFSWRSAGKHALAAPAAT
jgi:CheY-like chemotaxis protein